MTKVASKRATIKAGEGESAEPLREAVDRLLARWYPDAPSERREAALQLAGLLQATIVLSAPRPPNQADPTEQIKSRLQDMQARLESMTVDVVADGRADSDRRWERLARALETLAETDRLQARQVCAHDAIAFALEHGIEDEGVLERVRWRLHVADPAFDSLSDDDLRAELRPPKSGKREPPGAALIVERLSKKCGAWGGTTKAKILDAIRGERTRAPR